MKIRKSSVGITALIISASLFTGFSTAQSITAHNHASRVNKFKHELVERADKIETLKVAKLLPQEYQKQLLDLAPDKLTKEEKAETDLMVDSVSNQYQELWFLSHPSKK